MDRCTSNPFHDVLWSGPLAASEKVLRSALGPMFGPRVRLASTDPFGSLELAAVLVVVGVVLELAVVSVVVGSVGSSLSLLLGGGAGSDSSLTPKVSPGRSRVG